MGKKLMDASWAGDVHELEQLLESADANYTRHDGRTPLMLAAERGHVQVPDGTDSLPSRVSVRLRTNTGAS